MSGWKELSFVADEAQRALTELVAECNRQKCAEMLAHEETKKAYGFALLELADARKENDLMRQLLQVAVLSLPNDPETELLRKRICALGGQR